MTDDSPWILLVVLLISACSVTKPVAPSPTPESIQAYLSDHPRATLRVTDSTGHKQWIYETRLRGDTLRGQRNASFRWDSIGIALAGKTEVAAPHFSPTRTLGLLGGIAALVGFFALVVQPKPVY